MALQSSGQIKLSEIATEFGGSAPHALSEYYGEGNAPASGEIELATDFYGTSSVTFHGTRGVFIGGQVHDTMEYITIASTGNGTDFGNLLANMYGGGSCSNGSRIVMSRGHSGPPSETWYQSMEYITAATTGNSSSFGNMSTNLWTYNEGCSNGTRGCFGGGWYPNQNHIDYITIATTGNGADFGDLTAGRHGLPAVSNETRGVWGGGYQSVTTMDYVTIASTGNASSFGTMGGAYRIGVENETRGVWCGGYTSGASVSEYITIASTGNASSFGNLTGSHYRAGGVSNGTRGVVAERDDTVLEYITIATTGNGSNFGDLIIDDWEDSTGASGS